MHDVEIERLPSRAGIRFEAERNAVSHRRISNQSELLGVEIDTLEKVFLMRQGYLPIDFALIHRYETYLRRGDKHSSASSTQSEEL